MFYVYILRSETHPNQTYIGSTAICGSAFRTQRGKITHTNKFKP